MSDRGNEELTPGSPAERIGLVWPLTRELASLSKRYDAERRLQRHVTSLSQRENKRTTGRTKDLADAEALEALDALEALANSEPNVRA